MRWHTMADRERFRPLKKKRKKTAGIHRLGTCIAYILYDLLKSIVSSYTVTVWCKTKITFQSEIKNCINAKIVGSVFRNQFC